MKKTIDHFFCDDCGADLPQIYVKKDVNGEAKFDYYFYNTVHIEESEDNGCYIDFTLKVQEDYTGFENKKMDFCPTCRIKRLKMLLQKLEEEAESEAQE